MFKSAMRFLKSRQDTYLVESKGGVKDVEVPLDCFPVWNMFRFREWITHFFVFTMVLKRKCSRRKRR